MSKLAAFMGSNGGLAAGAVVVAVAAVGAGVYVNSLSEPEAPAPVEAAVVPEPEATAEEAPQEDTAAAPVEDTAETAAVPVEDTAETTAVPEPVPPTIDEVRVEADGLAIVAGRATPGSTVTILLDGIKNTETTADGAGGFAAVTSIPPGGAAQVLTVSQRSGDKDLASLDEVIIAPAPAPEAVETAAIENPVTEPEVVEESAPAQAETGEAGEEVAARVAEPETEPQAEIETEETAEAAPSASEPSPLEDTAEPEEQDPEVVQSAPSEAAPAPNDTPVVAESAPTPTEDPAPDTTTETAEVEAPAPQPVATEDAPQVAETAPEPAAPAVIKSTPEGVEILSSTPPEVLENIEIDTISYSQSGAVELAGRAQTEAEVVRVYVNNRPVADLEVDGEGRWRGALPQIDTGVYTLRVDELDATGGVTSRVETPFKREDPVVLAQADDPEAPAKRITVQTGNTLWGISRERYGDGRLYVQVFEANRGAIRNPDLIFPGQVFDLPE